MPAAGAHQFRLLRPPTPPDTMRVLAVLAVAVVAVSAHHEYDFQGDETFLPISSFVNDESSAVYSYEEAVKLHRALLLLKSKFEHIYERIKPLAEKDVHFKVYSGEFETQFDAPELNLHGTGFPWIEVVSGIGRVNNILGNLNEIVKPYILKHEVPVRSLKYLPYTSNIYSNDDIYKRYIIPKTYNTHFYKDYVPITKTIYPTVGKTLHSGFYPFLTKALPLPVAQTVPLAVSDEVIVEKPGVQYIQGL